MGEWDPGGKSRVKGHIFRLRIPGTDVKPKVANTATFTRTRDDFWSKDVLHIALELRRIYVPNYHDAAGMDTELLNEVWRWVGQGKNKGYLRQGLSESGVIGQVPLSVLLCKETARFFAMEDDFKKPEIVGEPPFVAHIPPTEQWRQDVHGSTFDYWDKLKSQPFELGVMDQTRYSRVDDIREAEKARKHLFIFRTRRWDGLKWQMLFHMHC